MPRFEDEFDFNFDRDEYDRAFDDDGTTRETECRDCHSTEVYWADVRGKWVLYDYKTAKRHVCKADIVTASRMDAFENLD